MNVWCLKGLMSLILFIDPKQPGSIPHPNNPGFYNAGHIHTTSMAVFVVLFYSMCLKWLILMWTCISNMVWYFAHFFFYLMH